MSNFSLSDSVLSDDKKYVLKTGIIFRAGNYEDKNFYMTPEELIEAAEAFNEPCPIDVEHVDNLGILNNKLGSLMHVQASWDGEELYGTAKIPVWLNELNKDDEGNELPFKVSSTIDRTDKKIKKLAIVQNPRVSDAALMAAFTRNEIREHPESINDSVDAFFSWIVDNKSTVSKFTGEKTYDGKWTLQSVHDQLARSGAVCTKSKDAEMTNAEFVSKEEAAAIQKLHDITVENGAECRFYEEDDARRIMYSDESSKDTKIGRKFMAFKDIKAWFANAPEDVIDRLDSEFSGKESDAETQVLKAKVAELTAQLEEAKSAKVDGDVKASATDEEKEQLKAQIAELQKRNLLADSEIFAENLIKEGKIVPANKEAVVALFMQAKEDDASSEAVEVRFSDEKVCKSRSELLAEFFSNVSSNKLVDETLEGKKVLNFNKTTESTDIEAVKAATASYVEKRNKLASKKL